MFSYQETTHSISARQQKHAMQPVGCDQHGLNFEYQNIKNLLTGLYS